MRMGTFSTIERIMEDNGLPVPSGRGNEKLNEIARIVETHEMPEDVRQRLRNLLALR